MTRLTLVTAAVAAAATGLAAGADGSSERAASLRLTSTKPLTVTGARFLGRESVSVRATVDGTRYTRRVRATRAGRLTATFAGITIVDRCNSDIFVLAIGARGSEATAKVGAQPQCPPRG